MHRREENGRFKINQAELIKAEKTALVIIDLQNGIANRQSAPYTGVQMVLNASRLANTFTKKGAFVVLVRVSTVDGKDMPKPRLDL